MKRLHENNMYHGDLQVNNIMVKYNKDVDPSQYDNEMDLYKARNYRYYLIDFGNSDYLFGNKFDFVILRDSIILSGDENGKDLRSVLASLRKK